MPHQVVVQVLGRNAAEVEHEPLESAVVAVDVLDVVDALLALAALELNQVQLVILGELDVGVHLVRYQSGLLVNATVEYAVNVLCGHATEVGSFGNRHAASVHGARNADLLLGQTALLGLLAALVSLPRKLEVGVLAVVSLVGNGEEGLVHLNDAVKLNGFCHVLKRVQNLVPPVEGGVAVDSAYLGGLPDGKTLHHAVDVVLPYGKLLAGARHDGVRRDHERLAAIPAQVLLSAVSPLSVANHMDASAVRAYTPLREALIGHELLKLLGVVVSRLGEGDLESGLIRSRKLID